jgi:phosphatidylglycerophosphatase A
MARQGSTGPGGGPTGRATPADLLATVLGSFGFSGFFPVAPATFASALATVGIRFVYPLGSVAAYVGLAVGIFLVGVWAATRMERLYGHDPSAAVIDEVLGMGITLAGTPVTPLVLLLGFVLFRFFDIVKLFPGRALERLPGGWGVMADDACAGVYAALVLRGILHFWREPRFAAWQLLPTAAVVLVLAMFHKPLFRRYSKKRSRLRAGLRGGSA